MYEMTARRVQSNESMEEVAQTVERARANPAAFEPLYAEYFPRIYRYCLRRVSCPQEAEDLTSLVFTRALANLSNYRGGSFVAWLFGSRTTRSPITCVAVITPFLWKTPLRFRNLGMRCWDA